jgi:hypothetical protein
VGRESKKWERRGREGGVLSLKHATFPLLFRDLCNEVATVPDCCPVARIESL